MASIRAPRIDERPSGAEPAARLCGGRTLRPSVRVEGDAIGEEAGQFLMRETIEFPRRQPAGLHHLVVGDALVTAVNDGTFQASFDLIVGIDHAECERLETAAFRPIPPKMTMNAFLVQIAGRRMLVDTGCGVSMGPTLGMLTDNLRSMGVEPEDIDTVLMTHLHPDHVNGLVDAARTRPSSRRRNSW